MSSEFEDNWKEFDPLITDEAPRVSLRGLNTIRQLTPWERLIGWTIKGRLPLAMGLLALFFLQGHSRHPGALTLTLALPIIYFWFSPLLGKHPSRNPVAFWLTNLGALSLGAALSFWPFELYLGKSPRKELWHYIREWENALESFADWRVALLVIPLLLMPLLMRVFEHRYSWLDYENRPGKLRRILSLALVVLPVLGLCGTLGYLWWKADRLDWVERARQNQAHVRYLRAEYVEKPNLRFEVFQGFEKKTREKAAQAAKDIPSEQFLQEIERVGRQLSQPDFSPSTGGKDLLGALNSVILNFKEPSVETARWSVELWQLGNRHRAWHTVDGTEELLDEHAASFVSNCSEEELLQWERLVSDLRPFERDRDDLDALIVQRADLQCDYALKREYDLGQGGLQLFGVDCGPSLLFYFAQARKRALLIDYDSRRRLLGKDATNREIRRFRSSPWYWPDTDLYQAYGPLFSRLNPERHESLLSGLRNVIALRKEKLETGRYPDKLSFQSEYCKFEYKSFGETAVLRKLSPGKVEWELR